MPESFITEKTNCSTNKIMLVTTLSWIYWTKLSSKFKFYVPKVTSCDKDAKLAKPLSHLRPK